MKKSAFNLLIYGISIVLLLLIFYSLIDKFVFSERKHAINLDRTVETHQADIVYGDLHSPQTIYVYFSYKCGYCKRFFRDVFPHLKKNYIEKGELKLVLKLVEARQDLDMMYALQVESGLYQFGEYDAFHKLLLHDSNVVNTDEFKDLCLDILSSNSELAQYVFEGKALKDLNRNYQEYEELKLTGTPSFIIKKKLYKGYLEYSELKEILED